MIFILILLFLFVFFWLKINRMDLPSKRILMLFVSLWFVVLLLSQLEMYGFSRPKNYTIVLLLISIFSFIIGFCLYRCRYKVVVVNTDYIKEQVDRLMNNKIFLVILIAFTIYMISLAGIYYEQLILLGSLQDIRTSYFDGRDSIYGSLFNLINVYILTPIVAVLSALFGYCLFFRRDWKLLIIFASLFIYSSLGGGRFHYIRLFVFPIMLIAYVFYDGRIKLKIRYILGVLVIGAILFFILSWTTMGRAGNIEVDKSNFEEAIDNTVEDILTYAYGPILAFDYSVEHNYPSMIGGYQYGRLTLHAIDDLFVIGLGTLSGIDREYFNPSLDNLVEIKQHTTISIGGGGHWNALYTWNLYFYNDLGVLGMFVFPFLIGFLSKYVICMFYKYERFGFFIVITFIFRALMFSFIDFTMVNMAEVLLMVAIYFFCKYKFKRPKGISV